MGTKHLRGVLAFVTSALIATIFFIAYFVEVRGRDLTSHTPIALENLDALGERLDPGLPQVEDEGIDEPSPVEGIETNKSAQSTTITSETLPARLERRLSSQEMTKLHGTTNQKHRLELMLRTTVMRVEDSVRFVFGKGSRNGLHTSSALAYDMMTLGDWESARRYLWKAAEIYETEDSTQCKITLGLLAWLEEDPEKAARLLELSCQGEFRLPYPPYDAAPGLAASQLSNAYRLCRETGSDVLAAHYLARLREEYSEFAEEYGMDEAS